MRLFRFVATLLLAAAGGPVPAADPVRVAAGIDHGEWQRLLERYVDERGLVSYAAWQASRDDRGALLRYLERLAGPAAPEAQGDERAATLINAYNALTVAWILENYPTRSIRDTRDPWGAARHRVGARPVSLDAIEHTALRPLAGYRVHAALVCAARSCPPLAREAYRGERLSAQLDRAMARWLARADLHRFDATPPQVSRIFDWFREDFENAGGLAAVLERHGPPAARAALARAGARASFLDYDWTLNDAAP